MAQAVVVIGCSVCNVHHQFICKKTKFPFLVDGVEVAEFEGLQLGLCALLISFICLVVKAPFLL